MKLPLSSPQHSTTAFAEFFNRQVRRISALSVAAVVALSSASAATLPTLAETAVVPAGGVVNYITLSPTGAELYAGVRNAATSDISLLVINTATQAIVSTVPLGRGVPQQIAFSPDGSRAYIAVSQSAFSVQTPNLTRVVVLDTATKTIVTNIFVGAPFGNIGVAVTPDGSRVYVTDRAESDIHVIATATNTVIGTIDLADVHGTGPDLGTIAIGITPDGTRAYVANRHTATVTVVRLADSALVATIPVSLTASFTLDSLAMTPDGKRAYVTYDTDAEIAVIDTDPASATYNTQIALVPTSGAKLREIAVRADGAFAFVASSATNEALIIDIDPASPTFHTELDFVAVGVKPAGIAVHGTQPLAYVANSGADSISVLGPATPRILKGLIKSDLSLLLPTTDSKTNKQIGSAIDYITKSLSAEYWVDGTTLTSKGGAVFEAEKHAVIWLGHVVKDGGSLADEALAAIRALADVDRKLAAAQLQAAVSGNGKANHLANAAKSMAAGDADVLAGKFTSAIEHYRTAWHASRQALGL